jgi:vacuolar-type H+-ATPase subunit H
VLFEQVDAALHGVALLVRPLDRESGRHTSRRINACLKKANAYQGGRAVNDNWMTDRVGGLRAARAAVPVPPPQPEMPADDGGRRQALQVLMLAQRTAEEHVAGARQQADKIHAQAQARAEQIVRDAQARAYSVRQETEDALSQARARAEQIVSDAQAQADQARRTAETIVSEARARADEIAVDARARAEDMQQRAQQRYEDVVGSLAAKREALQQDIEALEHFDHDYRAQLISFMQAQMRTLWIDAQHLTAGIEQSGSAAPTRSQPALQSGSAAPAEILPARQSDSAATTETAPAQQSGAAATTDTIAAQQAGAVATTESVPAQRRPSD